MPKPKRQMELDPQDKQCLALGRHVLRMIRDVFAMQGTDLAYCRQNFTFKRGGAIMFIVREPALAQFIEDTIAKRCDVHTITPLSNVN